MPALEARDAAGEYREGIAPIMAQLPPGTRLDRSCADHAIALRLLARGAMPDEVRAVLVHSDKAGDLGWPAGLRYVQRTVAAACATHAARRTDHGGGKPGER